MGIKISALPSIATPALTDVFPVVQGSVTYKETCTQLLALVTANIVITPTNFVGILPVAKGGTGSATGVVPASVAPAAGAGIPVQVIQGQFTSTTSIASATPIASGITATITPTAATSKILVRAVVNFAVATTDNGFLQLYNGTTAIGVGATAGSRTSVGAQTNVSTASMLQAVPLEWLDSPATTSPVTYSVQAWTTGGAQSYVNRSITDTDNAGFCRTASVITLMEIK